MPDCERQPEGDPARYAGRGASGRRSDHASSISARQLGRGPVYLDRVRCRACGRDALHQSERSAAAARHHHVGHRQRHRGLRHPHDPADDAHRPAGLLPGHGDADPDERFRHQDRGLAPQDDVEQQVPRHRRRRLPGRHHLQRARPRHPGGLCHDQQRSRHRLVRMQSAVLRLGRQYGKSAGDRVRRSGIADDRSVRTSGADQGLRLPGDPPDDAARQGDRQRVLSARARRPPISPDARPAGRMP